VHRPVNQIKLQWSLPRLPAAVTSLIVLIIVWHFALLISGTSEHVFPGPYLVALSFWELIIDGTLIKHSVASLYRVTVGFYLAIVLGIPLGLIIGRVRFIKRILNPVIQFLRPISPLAWIPLAMLWFGIGDPPAVFLIFLACFFPLVVTTTAAIDSINPIYFQVASNFRFSSYEVMTQVLLPAIVPEILIGLRLTVAIAWLVVVAAEMIAVQSGLGFLILDSRNALRMDYVLVGMIMIGLIGMLLDHLMQKLSSSEAVLWKRAER